MVFEGVPWAVDGGETSADIARVLAYAAIGGKEGVIGPTDLKVVASAIPDGNVHIQAGAAGLLNQFPGGSSQGYIVRNTGDVVQALTPQGSSGERYDLVAVIVQDHQYAGQPAPADPESGPYVFPVVYEDVDADTKFLAEVDADQTGYALALVHFNASDGTATDSDIVDLRDMLFARSQVFQRMFTMAAGTDDMPAALGEFPVGATWEVAVPPWANRVAMVAQWSGVVATDSGADGGTASGTCRVELEGLATDTGRWAVNAVGPGKVTRTSFQAGEDDINVPAAMRGKSATLKATAAKTGGAGMSMDAKDGSTVVVTVTFSEAVE